MSSPPKVAIARLRRRTGRWSNEAHARLMIERGFGLTDEEIERFYASINRIREGRCIREKLSGVDEMRSLLELKYQRRHP